MTFEQFNKILSLSEHLTGIQYSTATRQEVIDLCNEFYDDSTQYGRDDDHYYARLKDGSYTSDHDGGCKKSSLKSAKVIMFTSGWGTVWFFGREAQKDEQLLSDEFDAEILIHIEDYISEDSSTAEEIIRDLERAIEANEGEKNYVSENVSEKMIGLKKTDTRVDVVENPDYCESEKDGSLYCAAESERCSHLYDRIGRQISEDPWSSLDQGFGVFCLG